MKRWISRALKSFAVIVGIVMLTSFTIDAADMIGGSQSALSIFARKVTEGECPAGSTRVDLSDRSLCVDIYENSFSEACPVHQPRSANETQNNLNIPDCQTVSRAEIRPAVYVTFHQAQNLCARKGARLPTAGEWYDAAIGTPDTDVCNVDGSLAPSGSFADCRSAHGVYDAVGNAWEWVDEEVRSGSYEGVALPPSGYVVEADRSGVAIETGSEPSELFGEDYFWSVPEGVMVMMRGGFYRSGRDGGVFSVHADMEPSFTSTAIGFRCVREL